MEIIFFTLKININNNHNYYYYFDPIITLLHIYFNCTTLKSRSVKNTSFIKDGYSKLTLAQVLFQCWLMFTKSGAASLELFYIFLLLDFK